MDYDFLKDYTIIPVVVLNDIEDTIPKLSALRRGGIAIAEITFRTACAEQAIKLACREFTDMRIGAGTVLTADQCKRAIAAGASFVVSPGFDEGVFAVCSAHGVPYIAGAVTPTEIINIKAHGMSVVKFFPASVYGGVKAIKSLSQVFPDVTFVPTGGVSAVNLVEYLSEKSVLSVGGSWMLSGEPSEIEKKTREAMAIVAEYKRNAQ